jgi:hypothetical protein
VSVISTSSATGFGLSYEAVCQTEKLKVVSEEVEKKVKIWMARERMVVRRGEKVRETNLIK